MSRTVKWRGLLILVVILVSLYYLIPTFKLASLSREEREALPPAELKELEEKAIKLGLDLQGGMHLVLEVDRSKVEEEADLKSLRDRAETIIRNRVDKFGVAEPIIQTEGEDRIVVQLAGLTDEERAKRLIGSTALLEFKLVREADEFRSLLSTIDDSLRTEIREITMSEEAKEIEKELAEAAAEGDTTGLREELEQELQKGRSLLSMFTFRQVGSGTAIHEQAFVMEKDVPTVKKILTLAEEHHLIPPDVEILWDAESHMGPEGEERRVYLVDRKASITGKHVKRAIVRWGLDRGNPNAPGISLDFSRVGRAIFSRVTGENVGRRLAIVLDGKVHSAPTISEKIRGAASITGILELEDARALAITIEAGALPAPLKIIEERTVGPSLGADSIRRGVRAAIIGGIAVAIFMVLYYNLSGLLADLAVVLNLIIILAVLAGLGGTLTLPGIAGIILTIGMAVDANVLIFERIREELRVGKTVRTAIRDGYSRAFVTILDANITTLITAAVLYQFGTGPIRGFAVTLSIGILASMFTAIVVTRTIFDAVTGMRRVSKLSI